MKIELSFYQPSAKDIQKAINKDKELSSLIDFNKRIELNAETKLFDNILERTKFTSGLRFSSYVLYSEKELEQIQYFQILAKKVIHENDLDHEINTNNLKLLPLKNTYNNYKIRLIKKLYVSKINLMAKYIAGFGERWEEYICSEDVANIFKHENIKCIDFLPVYNTKKNDIYKGYFQLYSEKILPPAKTNKTFYSFSKNGFDFFKVLGSISYNYNEIRDNCDVFRTAEPIGGGHSALFIISRKVLDSHKINSFKGLFFRPVLDANSELYNIYIDKWDKIFDKISINPNNSIYM